MKTNKKIIPFVLLLANAVIKGLFLANNSVGGDEPFSIFHAQMDVASIIRLLSAGNNPPLYELLLHYWIELWGISAFSVRFLSLIFSCITVVYIYKIGIEFLNQRIGIYAAVIFIFSNYHIAFAHEARVYALLGMLSTMSMYYFLEMASPRNTQWNLVKLIAVNTLLIYSHYFGFFILITQFLFVITQRDLFQQLRKKIFIIAGFLLLFYSPNIFIFISQFWKSSVAGTWVAPPNGIKSIFGMLRYFSNQPMVTVVAILVCTTSGMKYLLNRKTMEFPFNLIVFWFVFIFLFMFAVSYTIPMFIDRYMMLASIAFCLMLSIFADSLIVTPKLKLIVPIFVCALFAATVKPNISNNRSVKETVDKVKELKKENSLVIICTDHFLLNFVYYYDIHLFKKYNTNNPVYANIDSTLKAENIFTITNIDAIDYRNREHIIYLDAAADFDYPNNNILNILNQEYRLKNKYFFYQIFNVYEFEIK